MFEPSASALRPNAGKVFTQDPVKYWQPHPGGVDCVFETMSNGHKSQLFVLNWEYVRPSFVSKSGDLEISMTRVVLSENQLLRMHADLFFGSDDGIDAQDDWRELTFDGVPTGLTLHLPHPRAIAQIGLFGDNLSAVRVDLRMEDVFGVGKVVQGISNLYGDLCDQLRTLQSSAIDHRALFACVKLLLTVIRSDDGIILSIALADYVLYSGFSRLVLMGVIATFLPRIYYTLCHPQNKRQDGIMAQSGGLGQNVQGIFLLFFTLIAMVIAKRQPGEAEQKKFLSAMTSAGIFSRSVMNVSVLVGSLGVAVTYIYSHYQEWMTGVPADLSVLGQHSSLLEGWLASVEDVHTIFSGKQCATSDEEIRITNVYEQMKSLRADLQWLKLPAPAWQVFQSYAKKIEEVYEKTVLATHLNTPRVAPLVLWFYGGTSVGKSTLLNLFATDMLSEHYPTIKADEVFKHCYIRNVQQEYWDGYDMNKKIVMYDDFGAQIPGSGSGISELSELIQACNIMPYPLHMADIADKKKTQFVSDMVLISSNTKMPDCSEMSCPVASYRRRNFVIEVVIKDGYLKDAVHGTRVLDVGKLADPSRVSTEVYKFRFHEPLKTERDEQSPIKIDGREWHSYDEMFTILSDAFVQARGRSKNTVDQLTKRFDERRMRHQVNAQAGDEVVDAPINIGAAPSRISLFGASVSQRVRSLTTNITRYAGSQRAYLLSAFEEAQNNVRQAQYSMLRFDTGRAMEILRKFFIAAAGVVSVAGAGFLAYKGVKSVMSERNECDSVVCEACDEWVKPSELLHKTHKCEAGSSMWDSTIRLAKISKHAAQSWNSKQMKVHGVHRQRIKAHMGQNSKETSHKLRQKCQFKIVNLTNNKSVNGMFVQGKDFLCPAHFLALTKVGDVLRFINPNATGNQGKEIVFEEVFNPANALVFEEQDVAIIRCESKLIPPRPKIVELFVGDNELTKIASGMGRLQVMVKECDRFLFVLKEAKIEMLQEFDDLEDGKLAYSLPGFARKLYISTGFFYEMSTAEGMCGSPLLFMDDSVRGHILGFHVAGSDHSVKPVGFSNLITREMLQEMLDMFPKTISAADPNFPLMEEGRPRAEVGEIECELEGYLSPNFTSHGTMKTQLRPSVLWGRFGASENMPAKLGPFSFEGKVIFPMEVATAGIFKKPKPLNTRALDACADSFLWKITRPGVMNLDKIRVESELVAINGLPGEHYVDALNFQSSVGFPLNKLSPGTGKRRFFEGEEGQLVCGEMLRARLDALYGNLDEHLVPYRVFQATLKDEKRPIAKVLQGKTRMFGASPADFVIAFRRFFLRFSSEYMNARLECEHAIGIDVFSVENDIMIRRMKKNGKKWMAMDYSAFDKKMGAPLLWAVWRVIRGVMKAAGWNEADLLKAECLYNVIAHPKYVIYNSVYQMSQTHPSGDPITSVINSIANSLIFRYCYMELARENDKALWNFRSFEKNVSLYCYGDDNIATVSDVLPWFNQIAIAEKAKDLGMVLTPATKEGELMDFIPYEEVTFLKRWYRLSVDHGVIISFRAVGEILDTLNWYRKGNDPIMQLHQNLDIVLFELHFHGREVYNKWVSRIADECSKVGVHEPLLSYDEQIRVWYSRYRVDGGV